jgi:hypothetical protein
MKKSATTNEPPAAGRFSAMKKLKLITKPTIAIIKHICLPPRAHEQTF